MHKKFTFHISTGVEVVENVLCQVPPLITRRNRQSKNTKIRFCVQIEAVYAGGLIPNRFFVYKITDKDCSYYQEGYN